MRFPAERGFLLCMLVSGCTGPSADVQDVLRVHEIEVDPGNPTLQVGSTLQLTAIARTGSGIVVTNRAVSWSSSTPELASVSQAGVVTANRTGGPVEISATVDGITGSTQVMVTPEPITRVTVTPPQTNLFMGNSTQLTASAADGSGHVVSGVTFSWQSSDPAIADVTGTGRVFAIAPGGPVTITARIGSIEGTALVTVSAVASRLSFTQQPANGVAGQGLPSPVRVMVLDPNGNPLGSSTASISLRLGNNPGGASLSGTLTVNASSGVAAFSDLRIDRPGTGYTLIASATALVEGTSTPFDIAPLSLAMVSQPSNTAVSGQPLAQQPVIRVSQGAVPLAGVPVTASIVTGGGTLGGGTTVTSDQNGLATFTNLAIAGLPGSRTLRFDAPGATAVSSSPIQVSSAPPGTPPHLGFIEAPPNGTPGRALSPSVRVVVQDANGSTVTSSTAAITIGLGNNPAGGSLGGTLTVTAVNGIASFGNLVMDRTGNGYTLIATSPGLTAATSSPFNILGISLSIAIDASATATSGVPFSQQPVILVRDATNTPLAGIQVTASILSGGGILGGSTSILSNGNGVASFNDLSISGGQGDRTLRFDATGAVPVTSNPIAVASVAAVLAFTQQPVNGPAGQPLSPPIQVAVRDQSGNTITGATNPVSIQLGSNPGTAVLSGTLTVNAVNGVATFNNVVLDKPGAGYTLVVSSSGLTGATSSSFTISPVSLAITTQPSATATSGQPFAQQPVVTVRDGANQPLSGIPVTVAIASGGGTLNGTSTVSSNASGVVSFASLGITGPAGTRTLSFSAAATTPVISNPIVVSPPPPTPTQLTFTQGPANGTVGQVLSPPVRVAIQDANGVTITSSSSPVTIQLGNPGTATLSGTLTVNAVSGVATFSNLALDQTGTGYTLIASSSGLPNRTSAAFDIGAVTLTITTQPSSSAPSGQAFAQQPVIQVRNAAGAVLGGVTVTASIATGGGTLGGTATATSNVNGIATFTNLSITGTPGNRTLGFAASGAAPVSSSTIAITPPPPSQLTITVQPSAAAVRNVAFPQQPVIQLRDASGNPVSQNGVSVTAALASGPGNAVLNGTVTVTTDSSGAASFTNLSINRSGTFTLRFTSGALQSVTSGSIVIP